MKTQLQLLFQTQNVAGLNPFLKALFFQDNVPLTGTIHNMLTAGML